VDKARAAELSFSPHIGLSLYGRFKSCGNANAFLLCMISWRTSPGLKPGMWTKRLLQCIDAQGAMSDWLFQSDDGSRMKMVDFNEQFYEGLMDIQRRLPELIEDDCDIYDDFHLARLFRRGATTRAQLVDVPSLNGLIDGERDKKYW
jgi:hypothetical protein